VHDVRDRDVEGIERPDQLPKRHLSLGRDANPLNLPIERLENAACA
jgi:hypothetical protein